MIILLTTNLMISNDLNYKHSVGGNISKIIDINLFKTKTFEKKYELRDFFVAKNIVDITNQSNFLKYLNSKNDIFN